MGRVLLGIPLELEVITELLANGSLDGIVDLVEDTKVGRVVLVIALALEDTSANQASVPAVQVSTDDVRLGVVTNHVDVLRQLLLAVDLLHPRPDDLVGDDVSGALGLTVDDTVEITAGQSLVLSLQRNTESTQVQTWGSLVLGGAEQITLGEVDGDMASNGITSRGIFGTGEELAIGTEEEVEDDLELGRLVVRLGEAHDSIELELGEVAGLGQLLLLLGELAARRDCGVPSQDILRVNHVLETVALGNLAHLESLTTANQNVFVVLSKSLHGGVRLNELVCGDGNTEDF